VSIEGSYPEEVIHLTTNTTAIIIDILGRYIYKEDKHADKATHPIEMNILDLLIGKLHKSIADRNKNEGKV